ncbi:uncharacterized protein AAES06_002051 [Glossophaga mutica]
MRMLPPRFTTHFPTHVTDVTECHRPRLTNLGTPLCPHSLDLSSPTTRRGEKQEEPSPPLRDPKRRPSPAWDPGSPPAHSHPPLAGRARGLSAGRNAFIRRLHPAWHACILCPQKAPEPPSALHSPCPPCTTRARSGGSRTLHPAPGTRRPGTQSLTTHPSLLTI